MMDKQDFIDKCKNNEEALFSSFMKKETTKLLLSMIPPSDNPDVLVTLLKSAYSAGISVGMANVMIELLSALRPKA